MGLLLDGMFAEMGTPSPALVAESLAELDACRAWFGLDDWRSVPSQEMRLDGEFTAVQLLALAVVMRSTVGEVP